MYDEYNNESNNKQDIFAESNTIPRADYSYIPDEPKKPKKKGRFFKKVVTLVLSGILFGSAAGGTMVGINLLAQPGTGLEEQPAASLGSTEVLGEATSTSTANRSIVAMDVSDVVEAVMPSIVAVNGTVIQQYSNFFGQSQSYETSSSGSGIIVGQNDTELLIATNNHVVDSATSLEVVFIDNITVSAVVKGTDSDSDLAVIAVMLADIPADTLAQIKIATLGDSDNLKVGQGAIAIGNALGYGQSVTVGYISAINREVTVDNVTRNLIQTDAAINPGNSGGALINIYGEVIGINAAKYTSTDVEGMGYAIPISNAQEILSDLMNKTTKIAVDTDQQGFLGIQGQNIDEQMAASYGMPKGVYVYQILENSPADHSDLMAKDVITKFDGEKVTTMSDIQELLTYYEGGASIHLTVQRLVDGQYVEVDVEITLGFKKDAAQN